MKILDLETVGYRSLPDRRWKLADERGVPARLVVVTGPQGAGLTSFLDAIAISAARLSTLGGTVDQDRVLPLGRAAARIRSTWAVDEAEARSTGLRDDVVEADLGFARGGLGTVDADPGLLALMSRYDHRPETSKVVSFPALRVTDASFSPISEFEADQRYVHLAPNVERFAGLPRAFARVAQDASQSDSFARIQGLFAELCPTSKLASISSAGLPEVLRPGGARVSLARLPLSERNAFVLAASVVLMGLERSVVLLDTPEMGLALGAAARWVDALCRATPEAQWIIASREPDLVRNGTAVVVELPEPGGRS